MASVKLEIVPVDDPAADFDALADADVVPGLRPALTWAVETVLIEQATRVGRMIQLHTESSKVGAETTEALGLRLLESLDEEPRYAVAVKRQWAHHGALRSCPPRAHCKILKRRSEPSWSLHNARSKSLALAR